MLRTRDVAVKGRWSASGRITSKVVPAPGRLATSRQPRERFTIACTIESPSPVPVPAALVVKKGVKIWRQVADVAGTSIGNLYFYLKNKEALLETLMSEARAPLWE